MMRHHRDLQDSSVCILRMSSVWGTRGKIITLVVLGRDEDFVKNQENSK